MSVLRQFVAPSVYIQGPDAWLELPGLANRLGQNPIIVNDPGVEGAVGQKLEIILPHAQRLQLAGEITPRAIDDLIERTPSGCDVVLGVGGGKALDAAKAVARARSARLITVPTAASNDAPTSQAIALYSDDDHRFMVESLGRNPDAVVADTLVLSAAPPDFLRYGIGDALAKAGEARGCAEAPAGLTPLGKRPSASGLALAQAAYQTLVSHGTAALECAGSGVPTPAFEAAIEAVILMSGLGFENGGLGLAHALTRGLMVSPRTRHHAHGAHVAYSMLVQTALDGSNGELAAQIDLLRSLGLPVSLREFGGEPPRREELAFLAEKAMTARPHVNNCRVPLDPSRIITALARVEGLEWAVATSPSRPREI